MDIPGLIGLLLTLYNIIASVYCATGCDQTIKLDNGRVRFKSRGKLARFRCNRGFRLVGEKFVVCLPSGKWSKSLPYCVKGKGCPRIKPQPGLKVEMFARGGIAKFSCGPGQMRKGPEQAWCNGKTWSEEPPTCEEGVSSGCDFEAEDNCGWSHDSTANFEWTRHSGDTPTAKTGPMNDHTLGTAEGHYMYVESSAPQAHGHTARLLSPPFLPDHAHGLCLEFYYHMFIEGAPGVSGALDVFVKPLTLPTIALNTDLNIFHREDNQGDSWLRADVDVPDQTEAFQIVFQGTRLKSFYSDIAIDDIRLFNCSDPCEFGRRLYLQHGSVRSTSSGKVLRHRCLHGYRLEGSKFTVCLRGRWTRRPPRCVRVSAVPARRVDPTAPAHVLDLSIRSHDSSMTPSKFSGDLMEVKVVRTILPDVPLLRPEDCPRLDFCFLRCPLSRLTNGCPRCQCDDVTTPDVTTTTPLPAYCPGLCPRLDGCFLQCPLVHLNNGCRRCQCKTGADCEIRLPNKELHLHLGQSVQVGRAVCTCETYTDECRQVMTRARCDKDLRQVS